MLSDKRERANCDAETSLSTNHGLVTNRNDFPHSTYEQCDVEGVRSKTSVETSMTLGKSTSMGCAIAIRFVVYFARYRIAAKSPPWPSRSAECHDGNAKLHSERYTGLAS